MANILLTYRQLAPMFRGAGKESINEDLTKIIRANATNDREAAAQIASFNAALKAIEDADTGDNVMSSPQHRLGSLLQTFLAEQAEKGNKTIMLNAANNEREAKFDSKDLGGWIGSFFTWWKKLFPQAWLTPPTQPTVIKGPVRLGVVADWGTGLYGAPVIANTLANDSEGFDIYLHLGDVYYSGTADEVRERFLKYWPTNPRHFSRALNSNHEMYSGGEGLFKITLPAFQQDSTCVWIELDNYVLVGLDTGYEEHDLAKDQDTWLRGIVAKSGGKKIVLFSHHQPYSHFESQGPKLIEKIGDLLLNRQIFAWYWGHEHRLVIYDRHPVYGIWGRCMGHGGMPYFRDDLPGMGSDKTDLFRMANNANVPGALVLDGPNPDIPASDNPESYGPNGYAVLKIDGARWTESFHLPDGTLIGSATDLA